MELHLRATGFEAEFYRPHALSVTKHQNTECNGSNNKTNIIKSITVNY